MLSAAKHLVAHRARCFAALSMTTASAAKEASDFLTSREMLRCAQDDNL
jgi:hypothetical protein